MWRRNKDRQAVRRAQKARSSTRKLRLDKAASVLEEHASNPATPERLRAGGGPPAARRYGRGESMEEQQAAVVLQAHARGSIDRGMVTPRTRQIRRGEGTMKAMEKAALLDDL